MKHTKIQPKQLHSLGVETLPMWVISLIIYVAPMFFGLFYDRHFVKVSLVIGALLLFLAYQSFKGKKLKVNVPVLVVILFMMSYIISLFFAVNMDLAVLSTIRAITYFGFVILVLNYADEKTENILLTFIYAAGITVAAVGLLAASNLNIFPDAFKAPRIFSTFQYPNTTAVFLNVSLIIGLCLMQSYKNQNIFNMVNFLLITALFGTISRGGILVYAITCFLLFISGLPGMKRQEFVLRFSALNFIAVLTYVIMLLTYKTKILPLAFLLVMSAIVYIVFERVPWQKIKLKYVIVSVTIILVGLLSMIGIFAPRLLDFRLSSTNFLARYYFYVDAFKVIADHGLFGIGGGGWSTIYPSYRGHLYFSKLIHNHYLETWIESGVLAMGSLLFIVLLSVYRMAKDIFNPEAFKRRMLGYAVFALAVHAAIDFTFSFGAVFFLFWTLIILQMKNSKDINIDGKSIFSRSAVISTAVLLLIVSSLYIYGHMINDKATDLAKNNDANKAIPLFKKAIGVYPFEQRFRSNLAQVMYASGKIQNKKEDFVLAKQYIDEALKYTPYNSKFVDYKTLILYELGEINEAVAINEAVVNHDPLDIQNYEKLMEVYLTSAKKYLLSGSITQAVELLAKADNIPQMLEEKKKQVDPQRLRLWTDRDLKLTPKMIMLLAEKNVLLHQFSKAEDLMRQINVAPEELAHKKLMLMAVINRFSGESRKAEEFLNRASDIEKTSREMFKQYIQMLETSKTVGLNK
ncbi:hypothetical protein BR63_12305 [Thermanaerosceptrum fracticalcis]|uniref:O-antigen ligase-related domain-containing protein n=1 Tax=Thermanaerosceptrum fracticalcis TaxID=1712410 RepID=A0A7G6E4L5_THEFR|nr:O-antigen ligase family protein [Thermanaerosceptrum fracticalcis]QNB47019.1 hypothetical protein BR63_12305 [Thermanaerosceptrum fracticalcis]